MTKRNVTRSDLTEFDNRVGEAYSQHVRGQFDAAIDTFSKLIDEWPDHTDANFGRALAYKASGQREKAIEAFTKTREIIQNEMSKATGDTTRFQMLLRMTEEHLRQLKSN